jgi:hypothetical protein
MFDKFIKRDDLISADQLNDVLKKFNLKSEPLVIEKKKNYTWLIVLGVVLSVAAIGMAVYKCFFEYEDYDEYDDFDDYDDYDDDFDDIDYDEDYDDEDFDEDIDIEEENQVNQNIEENQDNQESQEN